jgi:2-phosphosulfolactate phosphatase
VIAAFLREAGRDVTVVCAGTNGMFSLEDAVAAGLLIQKLGEGRHPALELSDAALAAQSLYRAFGRAIPKLLRSTEHGRHLTEIGFEADLAICGAIDSVPVLPQLAGSVVKLRRDIEKAEE